LLTSTLFFVIAQFLFSFMKTTIQIMCNIAPSCSYITITSIPTLILLQAGCLSWRQTNVVNTPKA